MRKPHQYLIDECGNEIIDYINHLENTINRRDLSIKKYAKKLRILKKYVTDLRDNFQTKANALIDINLKLTRENTELCDTEQRRKLGVAENRIRNLEHLLFKNGINEEE